MYIRDELIRVSFSFFISSLRTWRRSLLYLAYLGDKKNNTRSKKPCRRLCCRFREIKLITTTLKMTQRLSFSMCTVSSRMNRITCRMTYDVIDECVLWRSYTDVAPHCLIFWRLLNVHNIDNNALYSTLPRKTKLGSFMTRTTKFVYVFFQ